MISFAYIVFIAVIALAVVSLFIDFNYKWFARMMAFSFCAFGTALASFGFFLPKIEIKTTVFIMSGVILLIGHTGLLLQILENRQE
ncbi:MAG: hypothetical protein ABEJ65_00440 [bacterium]